MHTKDYRTEIRINVVNDTLSLEEMDWLLQCIREMERNKQWRVFDVFLDISDVTIGTGDTLSVDELAKLVQRIREIEQNKPERHINVLMDTPDKTVKEMEAVLDFVKPVPQFKMIVELEKKDET